MIGGKSRIKFRKICTGESKTEIKFEFSRT